MNYGKIKRLVLKNMLKIYYGEKKSPRYDWMGYLITDTNKPSYHHIVKREELIKNGDDAIATIENGAYLGTTSHKILHRIEQLDHELYECWNDLFLMINRMNTFPVDHVWELIFQLKSITEDIISNNKTKKL